MKTTILLAAGLACALLPTRVSAATHAPTVRPAALSNVQPVSHQAAGGRVRADTVARNAGSFRQEAKAPASAPPVADEQAEQMGVESGRYRFSILAGSFGLKGQADGPGAAARFDNPRGIAVDDWGNVYVSEQSLHTIRKISPAGEVTTLAGTAGQTGSADGMGAAARFNRPWGLAADHAGNVYVADSGNNIVRKIDSAGNVTTLAGLAGKYGFDDGRGPAARFNQPIALAFDEDGNLFVSDQLSIRKIAPDGTVSTFPLDLGPVYASLFYLPMWFSHLAVDHDGNVYAHITNDWDFSNIVKFAPVPSGRSMALALQFDPKVIAPVEWSAWAEGLGLDAAGNLYFTFTGNPVVVYTPATGETRIRNIGDGSDAVEGGSVAVDAAGNLFALPGSNWQLSDQTVRTGSFDPHAAGPIIQKSPANRGAYVGDNVQFAVVAASTTAPTFQWYFNSIPLKGQTGSTLQLPAVQLADAGKYYVTVSDNDGSTTSGTAGLTVTEKNVPPTPAPTPTGSGATGGSSGGGSFDAWSSLALLVPLAAALRRGRGPTARAGSEPAGRSAIDASERAASLPQ